MLRAAREEDRAFLDGLFFERKQVEFAALGWPPPVLAAFLQSQAAVRAQALAGLESWVIVHGEVPVGQVLVGITPGALHVAEMVVSQSRRGQGLGTAALQEVLARADAEQRAVRLNVEHGNPAVRLYRRLGFRDDGPANELGQPLLRSPA